jgi:hypothetical protein
MITIFWNRGWICGKKKDIPGNVAHSEIKMFWKYDSHIEQDILVTSDIHSVLRYSGKYGPRCVQDILQTFFFTFECCILLRIYLTDSLWRRQSQQSFNTLTPFNFPFYSLHVSAPTGHPHVIYTIRYYFCSILQILCIHLTECYCIQGTFSTLRTWFSETKLTLCTKHSLRLGNTATTHKF